MPFDEKTIVITGQFDGFSREEATKLLESKGANVTTSISGNTDLLFVGKSPGRKKLEEAEEQELRLAGEAELQAIREGAGWDDLIEILEQKASREFEKGARVKIVGGAEGLGVVGEIFWWGDSKYGEGMRAGVNGEDDETYWIDEENLGWPDDPVRALPPEPTEGFAKGDTVRVKSGEHEGATGEIFWWGKSKFGDHMRAGIESESGETIWADEDELEHIVPGADGDDDIPPPTDADAPPPMDDDEDIPF